MLFSNINNDNDCNKLTYSINNNNNNILQCNILTTRPLALMEQNVPSEEKCFELLGVLSEACDSQGLQGLERILSDGSTVEALAMDLIPLIVRCHTGILQSNCIILKFYFSSILVYAYFS